MSMCRCGAECHNLPWSRMLFGAVRNIRSSLLCLLSPGGVATPADAALMMQMGMDGVFVGSGIFKSGDAPKRARAIVQVCFSVTDCTACSRTAFADVPQTVFCLSAGLCCFSSSTIARWWLLHCSLRPQSSIQALAEAANEHAPVAPRGILFRIAGSDALPGRQDHRRGLEGSGRGYGARMACLPVLIAY